MSLTSKSQAGPAGSQVDWVRAVVSGGQKVHAGIWRDLWVLVTCGTSVQMLQVCW